MCRWRRPCVRCCTMSRRCPAARRVRDRSAHVSPRLLEGDLDAIVAKCLRKEPEHRYDSVEALELDIQRYLQTRARVRPRGRALLRARTIHAAASLDGGGERVRRDRAGGGLAVVAWQAHRVALERDIARRAATREEAVRYYLTRMFRSSVADHGARADHSESDAGSERAARAAANIGTIRISRARWSRRSRTCTARWKTSKARCRCSRVSCEQAGPEADPESVALVQQKLANVELQRGNTARAAALLAPAQAFWQAGSAALRGAAAGRDGHAGASAAHAGRPRRLDRHL